MNPIFLGKVNYGKLILDNKPRFNDYLCALEGSEVEVIVGKIQKPRTKRENRYYWGVVVKLISEEIGLSPEETHEALKLQFLKEHIDIVVKAQIEPIFYIRSTASLTTVEFEEYLTNIRMWADTFLNCRIPLPNEVDF
jgi:hypothetical protein